MYQPSHPRVIYIQALLVKELRRTQNDHPVFHSHNVNEHCLRRQTTEPGGYIICTIKVSGRTDGVCLLGCWSVIAAAKTRKFIYVFCCDAIYIYIR